MDHTRLYSEQLEPIIKQMKKICYENHVPMFVTIAVKDDGKETTYENTMVSSAIAEQKLSDDRIAKMVNVGMGYDVFLPDEPLEIEFESGFESTGEVSV